MNDSTIAVRYARALFESARDKDVLDEVKKDMVLLQSISGLPEFRFILKSPMFQPSQKSRMIGSVIDEYVQELTRGLIDLVVKNGRELFIADIARKFIDLYMKHKGIKAARLVSAVKLPAETRENIIGVVKQTLKTEIELTEEVDEDLIGGFVMTIEDQQYDASVAASLRRMKQQLLK